MAKSTLSQRKPQKPFPDFPLTIHPSGRFCKKITGRTWYFGTWKEGWQVALERYQKEKQEILAGINPRIPKTKPYSLGRLCDEYLRFKKSKVDSGEISARHFQDLLDACHRLIRFFGRLKPVDHFGPDQFEQYIMGFPGTWRLRRRKREITSVRSLFRYALDKDKVAKVKFGPAFIPPGKKSLDAERQRQESKNGVRQFTREQLRTIINKAPMPLKAMILLGINCGFGNTDCSTITETYLDLEQGWHNYPRPKTTIERKAKLWPETVEALRQAIVERPASKSAKDANLVFLSKFGRPWVNTVVSTNEEGGIIVTSQDGITKKFWKLLRKLGIKRKGLSFYSLRHCTETYGGIDQVAIDRAMGHVTVGMGTIYRGQISDDRLEGVARAIHNWLYGPGSF
jgi:integrase